MTKLEAFALAALSIIVMYGVFLGKVVYYDIPAATQGSDNWLNPEPRFAMRNLT